MCLDIGQAVKGKVRNFLIFGELVYVRVFHVKQYKRVLNYRL